MNDELARSVQQKASCCVGLKHVVSDTTLTIHASSKPSIDLAALWRDGSGKVKGMKGWWFAIKVCCDR